jgi:hypothetical protein
MDFQKLTLKSQSLEGVLADADARATPAIGAEGRG